MTKVLALSIFLFLNYACAGQNYNCFVPAQKQYFLNSNNYVRGIRIDSVKANGTDTIYYLFHTPRGFYDTPLSSTLPPQLDLNGGSWVGKQVIRQQDGTFLFDNLWGDTLIIKTQANLGDTWILFHDTTTEYYTATAFAIDTMIILGNLDSIKRIVITAYKNSVVNTADPINNFQIILSKNNGFAQVFDLYTFPYHPPDSTYQSCYDYYLDVITGGNPSSQNCIFNIIPNIATNAEMHDFSVGDIYEWHVIPIFAGAGIAPIPDIYYADTIKTKTTTSNFTQYTFQGWSSYTQPPNYGFTRDSGILTFNNTEFVDMPEESSQGYLFYYYPNDATYCTSSSLFKLVQNSLYFPNQPGQVVLNDYKYKQGLGIVNYSGFYSTGQYPGNYPVDTSLVYFSRNDSSCGTPISLDIPNLNQENNISVKIFPNPAYNELHVKILNNRSRPYNISIINLLGQQILDILTYKEEEVINLKSVPPGLYNAKISNRPLS